MKNILFVNDEPGQRGMGERAIKIMGHNPLIASDGQEALDIINKQTVDLMFLDLDMPNIGGLEVLAQLKKEEINIPTVINSSNAIEYQRGVVSDTGYQSIIGYLGEEEGKGIHEYMEKYFS